MMTFSNRQKLLVRDCIYCGKGKPTKEHLYGEWLKDLLPANYSKTAHKTATKSSLSDPQPITNSGNGVLNRNGSPHSHQLKIVCQECNNGWMSRMQSKAAPALAALVKGKWPSMNSADMMAVANYATMVSINLEFADEATRVTTPNERIAFMEQGAPLDNWQIYVGLREDSDQSGGFWHRAGLVVPAHEKDPDILIPNSQTTTFQLGNCFIHTMSGPEYFLRDPYEWTANIGIRRFWPIPEINSSVPLSFKRRGIWRVASARWEELGVLGNPLHSESAPNFGVLYY